MMKVFIDSGEWYPVYDFHEEKTSWNDEHEIPAELVHRYTKLRAEFQSVLIEMQKIVEGY